MGPSVNIARMVAGVVAVLALGASATTFVVREGEAALVTRVGEPVAVTDVAGVHLRLPWPIDEAIRVDLRRRVFRTGHSEVLTRDKKNVVVLAYAVWRVSDALRYHQAVGTTVSAELKLDGLIKNAVIGTLGRYDLAALVSTDPDTLKVDEVQAAFLDQTSGVASERYGIDIERIAFERISLPEDNVAAVFEQMRAERRQHAARFTAEGEQEAARIRSEADLAAARIRAEGVEQAARILGDAEAEAARIYAEAHAVDPDLYRFLRSLETIDQVVGPQTTVILRTDSEPFRLLEESR